MECLRPADDPIHAVPAPVCATCNDTHQMPFHGGKANCTRCPSPCQECRAGGNGAYCTTTPCACKCHVPAPEPKPWFREHEVQVSPEVLSRSTADEFAEPTQLEPTTDGRPSPLLIRSIASICAERDQLRADLQEARARYAKLEIEFAEVVTSMRADIAAERAKREEAEEQLRLITQTSGEECAKCGWRGILAGGSCAFCQNLTLQARLEEAESLLLERTTEMERADKERASLIERIDALTRTRDYANALIEERTRERDEALALATARLDALEAYAAAREAEEPYS